MRRFRSTVRRHAAAVSVILGCLVAVGCSHGSETRNSAPPPTAKPMELNVLVYNIEYSGGPATDAVIDEIDADVVGVLESYDRLPTIAAKTGYRYYNVGLQILSKYPIHEPSGADGLYALIEVQPGYAIAFFNTHLDYVKYGPRLLEKGVPVAEVLASENEIRTSSLQNQLPQMNELAARGMPVVLTGDFNQPSSVDYGSGTVGTRPGVAEPVAWPVSEALFDIGFRDTYREIHPDPVAIPGATHGFSKRDPRAGERIDYVYAGGPSTTTKSRLVGETDGPDVDIGFDKWTSDHRAVLSTLDLTPVDLPTTVSLSSRMLTAGDELDVYVNAPGGRDYTLAVVPAGASASEPAEARDSVDASGRAAISTKSLEPGPYEIVLSGSDGNRVATNEFWVRSKDVTTTLTASQQSYRPGEPIELSWDSGPANRWDWIGVYRASAADPKADDYLVWSYTGGHDSGALPPTVAGSVTLDESSQGKPWPLPPGDYVAHYLLSDQYESAANVTFTVSP
jgi:endonuclease/exonuclease/phosphatase family metal-dependent hydrolase